MVKKRKNSSGDSTRRKPWVDPDDAPEITDELLDRAVFRQGDTVIRLGRPPRNLNQDAAPNMSVSGSPSYRQYIMIDAGELCMYI